MEADKVAPPSTEARTPLRIFWKAMFSCCPARISRHCTRGRPASIITENWRVKMANSLESTPLPPKEGILNSLPFSESLLTLICSRASVAFTSALVPAVRSPWTVVPILLVPRYVNTGMTNYLLLNHSRLQARSPADRNLRATLLRRSHSTVNQVLQFIWIRRAGQPHFQGDLLLEIGIGQALVKGLHAGRARARLHG